MNVEVFLYNDMTIYELLSRTVNLVQNENGTQLHSGSPLCEFMADIFSAQNRDEIVEALNASLGQTYDLTEAAKRMGQDSVWIFSKVLEDGQIARICRSVDGTNGWISISNSMLEQTFSAEFVRNAGVIAGTVKLVET